MKYKLIKINSYWIIVSDETKENTLLVCNHNKNPDGSVYYNFYNDFGMANKECCKTVLFSSNPEHNLPSITFSDEVAKELGIVDVRKIVQNKVEKIYQKYIPKDMLDDYITLAELGYNQALSDNKDKLFTLEQLEIAIHNARIRKPSEKSAYSYQTEFGDFKLTSEEVIQSLTKQEFEVDLEMDYKGSICHSCKQLGNHDEYEGEDCPNCHNYTTYDHIYEPKITNNSIKVIKLIK